MKIFFKGILRILTLLFLFATINTHATHVWGGELEASCDGSGNYTFSLTQYVSCSRVTGMANSYTIKVFNKDGTENRTLTLNTTTRDTLPTIPNACANTVAGTCIGRIVATGTVNLPLNADGYIISYSSCCRNSNIENIVDPANTSQIYNIELPGGDQVANCNSSPTFNALPPSEICTNLPVEIDFSASDFDGDELKYRFVQPYGETSVWSTDQSRVANAAPPFSQILFSGAYSFNNPMNSGLAIDENTGLITGTPNASGLFALGVVVEEYRDGVLIGRKVRDFTYTVVPCVPTLSTGEPSVLTCSDEPVYFSFEFDGILKAGTTPVWDFGDPSSAENSSSLFDPNHQYSALGSYIATVSIEDSCGNRLNDTIRVDIIETIANVEGPDDVCKGDDVTLTCTDSPCELTEWYESDTSTAPMHIGCTYDFTLNTDRECIYFEPFVDPNDYIVGANAEQGWGTDAVNTTTFDAITPLTIEGFTLMGDQYWDGCANFNAMITVEQTGTVIAGPVFLTVDCDGVSVFNDLGFDVPQGTGYELKVSGATVRPAVGGPINQVGLIRVDPGGPFYNLNVHSNQKCARRDSICIVSECLCPDTSLTFPPNFCANQEFNLGLLKTTNTSLGTWTIKSSPFGSNPATITTDSIFNGNAADAGIYNILYTIDGDWPGCVVENERTIEVYQVDSADILDQGTFCELESSTTVDLSVNSTLGGSWSSSTPGYINNATGIFDPSSSGPGMHWLFYNSPSPNCPAKDSIEITVFERKTVNIITTDTTVCVGSEDFIIRSDANIDPRVWSGLNINDSLFSPNSAGTFKIKLIINGATNLCSESDSVTITVIPLDTAKITSNQGPFCKLGGNQVLRLDTTSTPTGIWESTTIGAISTIGVFNPLIADIGTHKIIYKTTGNCPVIDSIDIEVIDVLSAELSISDTSVCLNSSPFEIRKALNTVQTGNWNGISNDSLFTPSQVGDFKIKYVVEGLTASCSDSDSVTITVLPPDTAEVLPLGPLCLAAGNDTLELSSETTLGGTWSSNTGIVNNTNGEIDVVLTGVGRHWFYYQSPSLMCNNSDSVEVEIINKLNAKIANMDSSVCEGSPQIELRLDPLSYDQGTWSGEGVSSNLFSPVVAGVGDFKIFYNVIGIHEACNNLDSVAITISPNQNATLITPTPNTFCEGDTAIIIESQDTTKSGIWWSNPTGEVTNLGSFNPSTSGTGKFEVFYGIAGMCGDTSSVNLEVFPQMDPTITTISPMCEIAENINLSAVNTGDWSINNNVNNGIFSPADLGAGIHEVINTINDNCPIADTLLIEVKPNPESTINADTIEGCYPMEVTFEDLSDSNALSSVWTIMDGSDTIFQTDQLDSLAFVFATGGCFDVSIASEYEYGCKNTTKLPYQICTVSPPVADFFFDDEEVSTKDPKVSAYNNSVNANTYNWHYNGGRPIYMTDEEIILDYNINEQDTVDLTLYASNSWCMDSITKSIIIWDFFTLNVPNAFTPNGDGINEEFYPMGKNHVAEGFVFMIFNRWGDKIFETNTPYQGWDGTWKEKGIEVQQDIYVWKIFTKDIYENEMIKKTGTVALIR